LEQLRLELKQNTELILNLNSDQEEISTSWTCTKPWTITWYKIAVNIRSEYLIVRYSTSTSETINKMDFKLSEDKLFLSGEIIGNWLSGVQVVITCYTLKKYKYEAKVKGLQSTVNMLNDDIKLLNEKFNDLKIEYQAKQKEITDLLCYIKEREKKIESLSAIFIPLEEAVEALIKMPKEIKKIPPIQEKAPWKLWGYVDDTAENSPIDGVIKVDCRPIMFGQSPLLPGVLIKFEGAENQIYSLKKFTHPGRLELTVSKDTPHTLRATGAIYVTQR